MTTPIPTFPRELDGDYEVFFGETRYLLTLAADPFAGEEDAETLWGRTQHVHRRAFVRTEEGGERLAADYVQGIIMHELIHVMMEISGYYVADDAYSEEAVAGVLARPMLQMLNDPRNADVVGLLTPSPKLVLPRHAETPPPGLEIPIDPKTLPEEWRDHVGILRADDEPKFGRFQQVDLEPYIKAADRVVSDLAGLAERDQASTARPRR